MYIYSMIITLWFLLDGGELSWGCNIFHRSVLPPVPTRCSARVVFDGFGAIGLTDRRDSTGCTMAASCYGRINLLLLFCCWLGASSVASAADVEVFDLLMPNVRPEKVG